MRVLLTTAILANYYTFSLNVNGVSTPLQCSIGQGGVNLGTTTTCSDSADQVIVNAGDLLAIQSSVPGGAPTAGNAFMTFAMTFTGANPQDSVIGGVTTNLSATAIQYAGFSEAAPVATDAVASSVMPTAGTLDRLYVALSATQAAGSSYQFTIMKNGVATGLVATCDVSSLCGDLSDAVNIVAGDTISLQFCPSGVAGCQGGNSPAVRAGEFSLRFKPSVVNQAMLFGMPSQFPPVVAALRLGALVSVVNFVSAVDTNYQSVAPGLSMTLGNLTVAQCPGPDSTGAGGVTRTFTARMGGVNQTPTVAIPGSSISACPALLTVRDTTHTFQATSGALLNLATSMNTVTNASTLAELKYSMTATVP
jgi:hypothetical protein